MVVAVESLAWWASGRRAVVGGGRRGVGVGLDGGGSVVAAGGGRPWSDYVPGQVSPSAHDDNNNNVASPTTMTLGTPRLARFFCVIFILRLCKDNS